MAGGAQGVGVARGIRHRAVPDALVAAAALGIVGLWLLPIALLAAGPPCGGDLPCGPGLALVLLGPPALVYLVAIGIWAAADRVLPLLTMTALAAGVSAATVATDYLAAEFRPLSAIMLLAPLVLLGCLEPLREHRIERWLTLVALGLVCIASVVLGLPAAAAIAALAGVAVILAGPPRPAPRSSMGDRAAEGADGGTPRGAPGSDAAVRGDRGRMT